MQRLTRDQASLEIDAPPSQVYKVVSDVTRTPEWSREVVDCQWLPPATQAVAGARFVATNRRRWLTWRNSPVVTVADPGRCFAFQRTERGGGTLTWTYLLQPVEERTLVTLGYEVVHPVPVGLHLVLRGFFGVRDLQVDLNENIRESLGRLAAAILRTASPIQ